MGDILNNRLAFKGEAGQRALAFGKGKALLRSKLWSKTE